VNIEYVGHVTKLNNVTVSQNLDSMGHYWASVVLTSYPLEAF
jgi:hypothetical protein